MDGKTLKEIFARSIDDEELQSETQKLCATYVGGAWKTVNAKDLIIRIQSGGMNNFVFIVSLPPNIRKSNSEPTNLILRIYFSKTINDVFIESVISVTLAARGMGPLVLGTFAEGRIEEYIPSRILTNKELCNIHVGYEVGRILAAVHSLEVAITKNDRFSYLTDNMLEGLRNKVRWFKPHKMHTTLVKYEKELCPADISVDLLAEELDLVKRCLKCSGSPIVFTNNDLHEGNLLLRDGVRITDNGIVGCSNGLAPLVLIDYEYGSYYYRGFDFCHYCCECCLDNTNENWPGYHIMEDHWPSEEQQRRFAEGYLDEADKITRSNGGKRPKCVSDLPLDREAAIQKLMIEIRQFVAFPHLMWGIWSFKQAEDFPMDPSKYDFFEYGFDRLALYYKWKPEMMKYLSNNETNYQ